MIKQLWIDIKYVGQPRKRLLHHILNNHLRRVGKMTRNGVDPNPTEEETHKGSNLFWGELVCPPLFSAIHSGSPEMVKLLLNCADPTISVPRKMATVTCGVEDVWHINAVDYLIEFARGEPRLSGMKVVRWWQKPQPEPINPVDVKMNAYVEIYKMLRAYAYPSETSLNRLNCSYHDSFFARLKNVEECEIFHEQKQRILEQIEHVGVTKPTRRL